MKAFRGLCIFFLGASLPLFSQQSSAPETAQANQQNSPGKNHQITIDVVVENKSGKLQTGLQQEDFTLLDNKSPQKISSFAAVNEPTVLADPPSQIILLIDTVNNSNDGVADTLSQVEKYLSQNQGKLTHPTSIAVFSDSGMKMSGAPSLDGNALVASLKNSKALGLHSIRTAAGKSGDSDLFVSSLAGLGALVGTEAKVPGRKLMIWLSSGWPLLTGADVGMALKAKQDLFASVVATSDALRRYHVTLYNIDPENTLGSVRRGAKFAYMNSVKGVSSAGDVTPSNLSLQVLATQSGGKVLINGNNLAGEIQSCVEDANAFYTLTFEGAVAEHPNQYHSLEVKLNKPGLTARTTTGYYSQP